MRRELNVLALIKDVERYVYVYDEESRETLLRLFREQADDPGMTLNGFDAAVLTQKAHEQAAGPPTSKGRRPGGSDDPASGGRQPPD